MSDLFSPLSTPPSDPLFTLYAEYLADPRPTKINLGIGIYTRGDGSPHVFSAVADAAARQPVDNFNYDPIGGNTQFVRAATELLFGEIPQNLAIQQSAGGTHALAITTALLKKSGITNILIGAPTWVNHHAIFSDFAITTFQHLDDAGHPSLFNHLTAISTAPEKSALLLHGGPTHNPTGKNLSLADMLEIAAVANARGVTLIVDAAYLGFGQELMADLGELRTVWQAATQIIVAASFSKNASLYRHRLGVLAVKTEDPAKVSAILAGIVRREISNPPGFGASIMADVLTKQKAAWQAELELVRHDLDQRRTTLMAALPARFSHLASCRGLFGLIGLTPAEVQQLKTEDGVYLPASSRINFGGIKLSDIPRIAEAITRVCS